MIGTIVTIVSYVLLGLIIGISFLVGFKRGVKRSAIISGISFGLILIAYFITPLISTAILKIQISINGPAKPLSQIIIDAVSSSEAMETAIETSPSLKAFLEALPTVVINVVVFILLYAIVRLLGYIIYKIVERVALKSKKEEKELGLKRNRWVGAVINTAKALLFTFIIFAPITALFGFVDDIRNETQAAYNESSSSETSYSVPMASSSGNVVPSLPSLDIIFDKIPSFAMDGISAYNNNVLGKVGGLFGMDNVIFDGLTKIKSNGENIKFRQEALNYVTVYNTAKSTFDAINNSDENAFKNIDWQKMDKVANKILDGGLVKGLGANVVADVIKNYEQFTFVDLNQYSEILDAIKDSLSEKNAKEYFSGDFKKIYNMISTAGRTGILDTAFKDRNELKVLVSDVLEKKNKEHLVSITDDALSLNLLKDSISPATKFVLNKLEYDEFSLANNVTANWDNFKTDMKSMVGNVVDINDLIPITDIIDDPLSLLNINESKVDELLSKTGSVIDEANGILKSTDDKTVADKLLEKVELENLLSVKNEEINNYKDLMSYLTSPVKKIISFDLYNEIKNNAEFNEILSKVATKLTNESTETTYSQSLKEIVLSLYKIDALRTKVFDKIIELGDESDIIDFTKLNVVEDGELNFDKSYDNWANDVKYMTSLLVEFNRIKVVKTGIEHTLFELIVEENEYFVEVLKLLPDEKLTKILKPVLYTLSTRNLLNTTLQAIVDTLNNVADISSTINLDTITLKENANEDQADEINKIIRKMFEIYRSDDSVDDIEDLSYTQIGSLFDALKENAYRVNLNAKTETGLFKNLFDALYQKLLDTYPDAVDIIGDKPVYEINFTKLMKVIEEMDDAEEDSFINELANLVGEDVTVEDINHMIDRIGEETTEEDIEMINDILDTIAELDVNVITEDTATVIEENRDSIIENINNNDNIPQETKDKILEFLGLLDGE